MKYPIINLKRGRVKPIWLGHPWVFAEAIHSIQGSPEEGDLVWVADPNGTKLGIGYYHSRSAIPVRILSFDPERHIDRNFFKELMLRALSLRRDTLNLPSEQVNGYRLINSEGDGLPGVVVDVYNNTAAVQFTTLGMKKWSEVIFDLLGEVLSPEVIVEVAAGGPAVGIEGLIAEPRVVSGDPEKVATSFTEGGVQFAINLPGGQKTGFYLDQRENRSLLAKLSVGKRVLDGFCFMGGFGIRAAAAGAVHVTGVDSSGPSLKKARENAQINGLTEKTEWVEADVLRFLRAHAEEGGRWDVVVLDPPKFAHRRADVGRALPTYRRLNAAGIAVVSGGGILATSSCSGSISEDDLLRAITEGARDAGRKVQVLSTTGAAPDHPVMLPCLEGRYLKMVLCRVL